MKKIDYDENNFFDSFPEFYGTSKTGSSSNRLNTRYIALIRNNKEIIKNSTILDLASHDGRWSFAAIKNDARMVLGIEGRKELVEKSIENMKKYGIATEKYSFMMGDIFKKIKELKPNEFNVVFCFGIFYHIMNHMLLLTEIKRLNPHYLILDTEVANSNLSIIHIHKENSQIEGSAIHDSSQLENEVIVGRPSKKALELMLNSLGFDFHYYDWNNSDIKNWKNLEDYRPKNSFQFKKVLQQGGSVIKGLKSKQDNFQSVVAGFSKRRITLIAKNLDKKD